ncbi:twin-arginine translocation signal domain-containing protein [Halorussus sp. AFM4]|uniref:twin-arginine translocation signal domain-containing protein n=1 Tax=Halorussus sp. AFM4 TaxID=3421651 RepID=UPI003EB8ED9C
MTQQTSRRRFLKATAATGALAGLNATVLAQGQNEEVILLGGKVAGWQGYRLPGEATATGSANPTLPLNAGTTYTLMWQNLDGIAHTFAIQDAEGNNLKVLEPLSVQPDVFQQINETTENQTVSLDISDGNVTGVTTGNQTGGNMTGGNATGGQETTLESLVAVTQTVSEQGAVQGVRFTAEEKMAQYICTIHPNTMVGDITMETGGAAGNQTGNNSSM